MGWFTRERRWRQQATAAASHVGSAAAPRSPEHTGRRAPAPIADSARVPLFRADDAAERPVDLGGTLDGQADLGSRLELSHWIEDIARESRDRSGERLLLRLASTLRREDIRLPAMPEVILQIERLVANPDFRLAELAAAIERDPTLATRVVGVSNSPFYLGMEPVRSVQDALVRLGVREVRHLVMALALRGRVFVAKALSAQAHALWQHALASSIAARSVAEAAQVDPDPAFFLGLVHDLGRLVLLSLVGDTQRSQRADAAPDLGVLASLSDQIHARLGALVATSWRLAPDLVHTIACHHAPLAAPAGVQSLAHVLAVADELAHSLHSGGRAASAEHREASATALGLAAGELDELAADVARQLEGRFPQG